MRVEMRSSRVLVEASCHLMLGLLNSDTFNVINSFTRLVILPPPTTAGNSRIKVREIKLSRNYQLILINKLRSYWFVVYPDGPVRIALIHQDPADERHYFFTTLIQTDGTHPSNAGISVAGLSLSNHCGVRGDRVTRINWHAIAQVGIAKIGNCD